MKKPAFTFFTLLLLSILITIILFIPEKEQREDNEKFENPNDRQEQEFLMLRDPVTNKIPNDIYRREQEFINKIKEEFKGSDNPELINWTERGPNNVGGRARALGIDVRTTTPPNIIINAGGVSGGLWRSTNDGVSWTKSTLNSQLHSTTCMIQDTRTGTSGGVTRRDIWYAGSGESYGNSANGGGNGYYLGDGIFKTTNNGLTWAQIPSTVSGTPHIFDNAFDFVFNIAIDPSNTTQDVVYAAACQLILKSTNGGNNWSLALGNGSSFSSAASDVQVTSTGIVYATINSTASANPGIWKSTNSGVNWTNINPSFMPATYNRIVIGIAPSNENIIYFMGQTPGAGKQGVPGSTTEYCSIWRYIAGTSTWTDLSSNIPDNGGIGAGINTQGSYNIALKVKPDNSNYVIFGGTNLYRSTDGFATLVNNAGWIGGYSLVNNVYTNHHPDIHALTFSPGNNIVMYSGSDGGLSRTDNVTANNGAEPISWVSLNNGFNVTQFYSVTIAPESGSNFLLGGTQDNGNLYTSSSGLSDWTRTPEFADGCFTAIAPIADDRFYAATQNGVIRSRQRNMNLISTFTPAGSYNQFFVNPFVLDPNNSSYLYYAAGNASGNSGIWRNNNVKSTTPESNWSFLSTSAITGYRVSAIGISINSNQNVLYYGTSGGAVYRIDNANTGTSPTVTNISAGLPTGGYVNCIAVDPASSAKAIVVFTNYNFQSLWYTTNSGATWADIEGNLSGTTGPSVRWAEIFSVTGINHYFLGTSVGLFYTTNLNGTSTVWYPDAANTIGNNVIRMLKWRAADNTLAAATHGRGIFSVVINSPLSNGNLSENIPDKYILEQNYPNPFNSMTKVKWSMLKAGKARITVYDVRGREVEILMNTNLIAGVYETVWNAAQYTSGVYFYRLQTDGYSETRKMLLMK